jgi:LacI family gluconate utilization system Gnt-I transcriptional repressor
VLVPAPTTLRSGRAALAQLLEADRSIDAVFCSSDLLALGVLIEAQASGLDVPRDLGVIGFGDLSMACDLHPALTTVRIDGSRIGAEAARCIVDRSLGVEGGEQVIDIGFSIVERASV